MAQQLTIFVENRPGRIKSVSDILMANNLNIWAFAIQDRGEFGLIKVVVDRPEQARLALADHGFACALKDVLAVTAPDKPGNLDRLTTALLNSNVNIADAYGFVTPNDRQGMCFLEIKNAQEVNLEEVVTAAGFTIVKDEDLYEV
ncbi:MAG: hypothetical protein JW828_00515 [Sedimentisphaerales bacterium]|nr:hypothetical protein [Sedimentisphaerales bacterium]